MWGSLQKFRGPPAWVFLNWKLYWASLIDEVPLQASSHWGFNLDSNTTQWTLLYALGNRGPQSWDCHPGLSDSKLYAFSTLPIGSTQNFCSTHIARVHHCQGGCWSGIYHPICVCWGSKLDRKPVWMRTRFSLQLMDMHLWKGCQVPGNSCHKTTFWMFGQSILKSRAI